MFPLVWTSTAPTTPILFKQTSKSGNMSAKSLLVAALSTLALGIPLDGHVEERQSCAAQ